ncbi:sortase B protein-sorting domain-containing protein [Coprobacillus sp. AF13-15]|nr:sortase B protein-sorting domain-containing protein [Coprobacillus sp. AF13-4LB]RHS17818.1 sortase B protein-sorting domain-containing protein [Coprobacillus sp. AF13-15]RHS18446.1 sortase B protein-sorting domain-containing protein [Coprobacillus sp. AF13-25]
MRNGHRKSFILGIIISIFFSMTCMSIPVFAKDAPNGIWTDYAATDFAGGSGIAEDPWQIETAEQLAKLAVDVNSGIVDKTHAKEYFVLTADLDLSAHRWIPIGYGDSNDSFHAFSSYFNGNNKTITGLYVDETQEGVSAGLFGNFSGYELKNIILSDAYVKASCKDRNAAGVLIGNASQGYGMSISVSDCKVSGTVENTNALSGGLVGYNSYGTYKDCMVDVEVIGGGKSGGFIGEDFNGIYQNCIVKGNVRGSWSVGGFAGVLFFESGVNKCASYGKVTASDWNVGGFAGYVESDVEIKNSVAFGDVESIVTDFEPKVGGFAGTNDGSTITKSHSSGKITSSSKTYSPGGFVGNPNSNGIFIDNSFDVEKNPNLKAMGGSDSTDLTGVQTSTTKDVLSNICEDYYGEHDWNDTMSVDKEATCTESGEKSFHCRRCDVTSGTQIIDPKGHHLQLVEEKPATCTEDGFEEYWKCEDCGLMYSDSNMINSISEPIVIKATGHKFGNWQIVREATEKQEGEQKRVCEVCKYEEIEKISKVVPSPGQEEYKILDGADSSWTQDAHKGLVIRGNGEFSKFKCVKVDGIIVDTKNYTVSEGSTVVTLKEDYLNTLAAGKHTFEIVWTDGLASTTFTVVKDNNNLVQVTGNKNSIVTKTGDTANYVLYSILLMISFVGLVVTVKKIEMI